MIKLVNIFIKDVRDIYPLLGEAIEIQKRGIITDFRQTNKGLQILYNDKRGNAEIIQHKFYNAANGEIIFQWHH